MGDNSIYIIGYGNPGRQDDGLGPAFIHLIDEWEIACIATQMNYQLTVEDACDISRFNIVIFVDATRDTSEAFYFREIGTSTLESGLSSHSLSPQALIELCNTLFYAFPFKNWIISKRECSFKTLTPDKSSLCLDCPWHKLCTTQPLLT
ncbi:MAG: hypothetical protein P8Y45_13855 [Exilibacterium sp.]